MSYILDALKKSEQERQQEKSPNLHSVHRQIPGFQKSPRQKGIRMVLLTLTLLAITTGVWISYYFPQPLFFTTTQHELKTDAQQALLPPGPSSETAATVPPLVLAPNRKKIIHNQTTNPAQQTVPPALDTKIIPVPPYAQELPFEIQSNIPEISLAGHTYSETPTQRMVIVNNKILREGDKVNTNIRLIEITWEGVILDYNGTRFQQDTK